MKKPAIKPRNALARDLWQCRAFHARTGPDKRRKAAATKPSRQQLRNTADA